VAGERGPTEAGLDEASWRLVVDGLVDKPFELTLDEIYALSTYELMTDIHCVTGWSYKGIRFTGFPLAHLLNQAEPKQAAGYVWFGAYSDRNHDTSLPIEIARLETWRPMPTVNRWPWNTGIPYGH
jgi:DMSO/TMAO reductase YedYZ molybdopterin-dependent catalytic subunit